ncbi:MAG: DUF2203 domain-containing protein [Anaerolineae bacterium]|nr:DUF2203 domain-containing protein [Caldilineales bacterium]MCX7853203.1 DUF2203 domain-containing protein [Caldilineales bacterium]MDW8269758.1 DUF2203 domain-containing protein [Anaerolineae bacterium]
MRERRLFTVAEANALLPRLTALLDELRAARDAIRAARADLLPVLEAAIGNGGSRKAGEMLPYFERMERAILTIRDLGCELKDIDMGLVDFPALREGRVVYLCWRYGEDRLRYWHELDTGFAGRQPL